MTAFPTLEDHLSDWAGHDVLRNAVCTTLLNLAGAGTEIARIVQRGPLAGNMAGVRSNQHGSGDTQKELDVVANELVRSALEASPVAWMGSEEDEQPQPLNEGAPLVVNTDPLDGSSNIDTNVSIGTIFSVLPAKGDVPLLQTGRNQLAAGYIIYGPQTAIALTVGQGTHLFWLDPHDRTFLLGRANVMIPEGTREFAINASNARFWAEPVRAYIDSCVQGAEGPRSANYNMRWIGSLVADTFRILMRGGVFLYPGDSRKGYEKGRLRLLYEASPIAMLIEQAGGAATTGTQPVLDVEATALHQRAELIFGSKGEVNAIQSYFA
jgi:fructose-1,6-bisphosphatase I